MTHIRTQTAPRSGPAKQLVHMMWLTVLVVTMSANAAFARSAPDSFADLAAKLLPAVVNISTKTHIKGQSAAPQMPNLPPNSPFREFFKEFFDHQNQQRERNVTALGSGFIISRDGYIVTNNHVIKDADQITVILHDDTQLPAKLIGHDPRTDLALLKVDAGHDLQYVSFGNSDKSRVGDWVMAIGNPFGLGGTVTAGIISARGRDINAGPYDDFIQTDAAINRGNSGGPLFNMDGEVVGINTAIFSPSGGSVGLGFSIPSSTAKPIIAQLREHGEVRRGWLGVHIQQVTDDIASTLGLDKARGALVANIDPDGPAASSSLKVGDVILKFNGKDIDHMRELPRVVADTPVGKKVKVDVWRDGKPASAWITLGKLPEQVEMASSEDDGSKPGNTDVELGSIGLTASPVTDATRKLYQLDDQAKGVIVTAVDDNGPAAEKGIVPGDLIVEVSRAKVSTPADIQKKIDEARKSGVKVILMLIESQSGPRFVTVGIGK